MLRPVMVNEPVSNPSELPTTPVAEAIVITHAAGATTIELRAGHWRAFSHWAGPPMQKKAPEGAFEDVLQIKMVAGARIGRCNNSAIVEI